MHVRESKLRGQAMHNEVRGYRGLRVSQESEPTKKNERKAKVKAKID